MTQGRNSRRAEHLARIDNHSVKATFSTTSARSRSCSIVIDRTAFGDRGAEVTALRPTCES